MAISGRYVSLHYFDARSNKDYDLQLYSSDDGSTWTVTAQHGRHGGTLRHMVKAEGVSYYKAEMVYEDLLKEKVGKGYTRVGLKGESLRQYTLEKDRGFRSIPQPSWPGWEEGLQEVLAAFGITEPSEKQRIALVVIGDLSQMLQEGLSDAMDLLSSDSFTPAALGMKISPECKDWWASLPRAVRGEICDLAIRLVSEHKSF